VTDICLQGFHDFEEPFGYFSGVLGFLLPLFRAPRKGRMHNGDGLMTNSSPPPLPCHLRTKPIRKRGTLIF
jgi:hypothetical protein